MKARPVATTGNRYNIKNTGAWIIVIIVIEGTRKEMVWHSVATEGQLGTRSLNFANGKFRFDF